MPNDFSPFGNLTAQQKTLLTTYADFADATNEVRGDVPAPDVSQTYKQAKNVDAACRDIITLIGKAQRGARLVLEFRKQEALKALDV